jgi:hypothetical protein
LAAYSFTFPEKFFDLKLYFEAEVDAYYIILMEKTLWDDIPGSNKWLTFTEARKKARELGFEYKEEWDLYIRGEFPHRSPLPGNIPVNPDQVYRYTGWKGWKDWLVPEIKRREYSPFIQAREFVRCLRLKNVPEWREYIFKDERQDKKYNLIIPDKPDLEYMHIGWRDWDDWLGRNISFKDHDTTRNFVATLKLKNKSEWESYCNNQISTLSRKPENIYRYPEIAYSGAGWISWDHWLGVDQEKILIKTSSDLKECRCRGMIRDCPICDGKGYIQSKQ